MTVAIQKLMSIEEYGDLPEGPPHYEFEEGELIPVTSPTPEHQDIVDATIVILRKHIRQQHIGRAFREVDVYLEESRVYIPDISYLSSERSGLLRPIDRKIHGAPNLIVEITSGDAARDRIHKLKVYHRHGVEWYWIIDQTTLAIEEYKNTPEGYLRVGGVERNEEFKPKLFDGLVINLATELGLSDQGEVQPNNQ